MDILYYSIKIKRFNYRLVHISLEVPVDPRKELPIDTNYLGSLRSEPIHYSGYSLKGWILDLSMGRNTVSGIQFCRISARTTQSQNVPVSCFSQPIGQWSAQAA